MCEHTFVRWREQETEQDGQGRLPGYSEAVVRHFDAPEALDTRFYEVHAKSALNAVPAASRMPFRWTINPYRGCSHACAYCMAGETPVLMADGSARRIEDLRVGDAIYGTVRSGPYRRYVKTEVLAHWSTLKPGYRITLEDGTTLVASGDHRFLSNRGWKYVTGSEQGAARRPHLTLNNELMGVGAFAQTPAETADYRRGYLSGLIMGDGHIGSYSDVRPGRAHGDVHRFRLALTDFEALERAQRYLLELGVVTEAFEFKVVGGVRPMRAIRTQARAAVERVKEEIRWPWQPSPEWRRGFLAGIFDAEGSGNRVIRISNTDRAIIEMTRASLVQLGFDTVVEDPGRPDGLEVVRLRGGLRERLRFFHTVDPAIRRKLDMEGKAVKGDARLRVMEIEPLATELPMYDITTGTGDFIADGVVSHNCFARPTHEYLELDAGRDFEKEIVVKVNVPEVLRVELARPSWKREHVALGTNTDPYQWVEGRYKLMRGIWEAMRDFANPCSILTKSPLVLRDKDLLLEIKARTTVSACLSVPTLDEKAWRATEPHTPHPRARLEAVAELNRIGIPTGILIAPLMPGINDGPGQVERIIELADEAGATSIGGQALFLRGATKDVFFDWLRAKRPDLVERYEQLYRRGAYLPADARDELHARLPRRRRRGREVELRFDRPPPALAPRKAPDPPRQATLF
jgi:DNA repair photolyase